MQRPRSILTGLLLAVSLLGLTGCVVQPLGGYYGEGYYAAPVVVGGYYGGYGGGGYYRHRGWR